MKTRNFVAKYAKRFNKAAVMKDRKREMKKTGEWLDDRQEGGKGDIGSDRYRSEPKT